MTAQWFRHICYYLAISILAMVYCVNDAPHDNPLDPFVNPNQAFVNGFVYSFYPPYHPIPGATVHLIPGNYIQSVNDDGSFAFEELAAGEYELVATAPSYDSDTIRIHLETSESQDVTFRLNALPSIRTFRIRSGHIHRWFPPQSLYVLDVEVDVSDADGEGDISLVQFSIPGFSFSDTLVTMGGSSSFVSQYYISDLSISTIHGLLGHPMYIEIKDQPGAVIRSEPAYLARVIDTRPNTLSPQGLAQVSARPDLNWQPLQLMFPFSWQIDVTWYDQETRLKNIVWTKNKIHADSTHVRVSRSLDPGIYYWTVSIVDEFGNWSRSREGSFEVIE